jgi:hypothetical protein
MKVLAIGSTTDSSGVNWVITRLPSARNGIAPSERKRPWLNREQEQARRDSHLERVRRENGIPSPQDWMW